MANKFLFEGTLANGLNDTNIRLIPKTANIMIWLNLDPLVFVMSAIR